mgnify:CR=1 FL=1
MGKRIPFFGLKMGRIFPLSFKRKVRPILRAHSGMYFPVEPQAESMSHFERPFRDAFSGEQVTARHCFQMNTL